jgi:two-component system chemotaxis sensor kinase CheA
VLVVDDSITTRLQCTSWKRGSLAGRQRPARGCPNEFDVVIADVEMPAMNGFELTQRIRESNRTKHLPVILLTSLGKPEQREAGLKAGADAYLVKSQFEQDELLRTIQAVI